MSRTIKNFREVYNKELSRYEHDGGLTTLIFDSSEVRAFVYEVCKQCVPSRKKKTDKCPYCGRKWIDHPGFESICNQLQESLSALKVIRTWASFEDGRTLDPDDVVKLIDRTWEKIQEK